MSFPTRFVMASDHPMVTDERVVEEHAGFVVVENITIPMEHGWCVTEEGSLVDVTLRKPIVPVAYFGVVFNSLFAATRDLPALEAVLIENAEPAMWRPFPSAG